MRKESEAAIMRIVTKEIDNLVSEVKENSEYYTEDMERDIVTEICRDVVDIVKERSCMFGYVIE